MPMKVINTEFITGAVSSKQYPKGSLPEFAFAGRSNVGKSSLIRSLLNRKKLVRISSSPGKTREINFFRINEKLIPGKKKIRNMFPTRLMRKKL